MLLQMFSLLVFPIVTLSYASLKWCTSVKDERWDTFAPQSYLLCKIHCGHTYVNIKTKRKRQIKRDMMQCYCRAFIFAFKKPKRVCYREWS